MSFTESLKDLVAENRNQLLSVHPSWSRVPLADVALIQNGFPFESKYFNAHEGMPLIRIRDVLDGETETYFSADYEEAFVVQRDDLLIGMDGDFHCSLWAGRPALLNQRVCRLFPNELFYDKRFLRYALPGYLSAINSATSSITVKHLSSRTVAEILLPLPPLPEQHRIVEKIEELFSDLDAGVASLERAKANLKRYRASVLKSAVEGRLTEEWRKEHPQAEDGGMLLDRILRERREKWAKDQLAQFKKKGKEPSKNWQSKYEEPSAPDTSELPELPEGWVWATVEQLVAKSEYGTSVKCDYKADGLPVLRIPNIAEGRIVLSDLKRATQTIDLDEGEELRLGDLLMCRTNGSISLLGKTALVANELDERYTCASYLLRFRFVNARQIPSFTNLYLTSRPGRSFIEGNCASSAGQHNISLSVIHRMPIPLPPLAEQEQIVALVEERLSQIDSAEKTIDAELIRSKRLRQSILKRAFEGNLVPRDPKDEPASVLLERIKASRDAEQPKNKAKKATKVKAK